MDDHERFALLYMPPEYVPECIYYPNMYSNHLLIPSEPLLADFVKYLKKDHRRWINPKVPRPYRPSWYLEDIKVFLRQYRSCWCTPTMMRYILRLIKIGIKNHGLEELFKFNKPDLYSNIIMQNRKKITSVIFRIKQIKLYNKLLFGMVMYNTMGKTPKSILQRLLLP